MGTLQFDVLQHTMRAKLHRRRGLGEPWRARRRTAHTKQYRDVLQPISGSPLDERVYKTVE